MTNSNNQILVQNVENFKTILTLPNMAAFDEWMYNSSEYAIVTLDEDPDGEYAYVALVASDSGPDYFMDSTTGEMEPVEKVDPAIELELKMDIMMEINDDLDETIVINPTAFTPPVTQPRTKRNTQSLNNGAKMKAHQYLQQLITSNPGISRTAVFSDQGLRDNLLDGLSQAKINTSDKLETKRWNRRLNRFIRQMRRDGVDINIERKGRVAHYTIGAPDGQLELPFTPAAAERNAAITRNDDSDEVLTAPTPIGFTRADDEANVNLSFEDLLSTLDDEAVAAVTNEGV